MVTLRQHYVSGRSECSTCDVGVASGLRAGGFCPFIDRRYRPGAVLYIEGEEAHHVWYVKYGTVTLARRGRDDQGEGRVRAVRFAGSFIGLEAMASGRYLETARTAAPTVLCGITREGMDRWLGPSGTPARTALELALRASCRDLAGTAAPDGTSVQRVARWLAADGPRGETLQLPRRVMADLLGMRPETFSRALADLARRGAISVTRTTLRISDEAALEAAATGE